MASRIAPSTAMRTIIT